MNPFWLTLDFRLIEAGDSRNSACVPTDISTRFEDLFLFSFTFGTFRGVTRMPVFSSLEGLDRGIQQDRSEEFFPAAYAEASTRSRSAPGSKPGIISTHVTLVPSVA